MGTAQTIVIGNRGLTEDQLCAAPDPMTTLGRHTALDETGMDHLVGIVTNDQQKRFSESWIV